MKNLFALIVCIMAALMLNGCRAHYPVAQESGIDDSAYLLFISTSNSDNHEVDVTIDGTNFKATTVKAKKSNRRGSQYKVNPGIRKLKVVDNGTVVYDKTIILSNQETKKIELP